MITSKKALRASERNVRPNEFEFFGSNLVAFRSIPLAMPKLTASRHKRIHVLPAIASSIDLPGGWQQSIRLSITKGSAEADDPTYLATKILQRKEARGTKCAVDGGWRSRRQSLQMLPPDCRKQETLGLLYNTLPCHCWYRWQYYCFGAATT